MKKLQELKTEQEQFYNQLAPEQIQPESAPEQIQPQPEELTLSDGIAEQAPEFIAPELNNLNRAESLQDSLMTTTATNNQFFTQGEFEAAFNEFLSFLKNPATAADTFETVRAQGQSLAASKIYEMANKYKWLNWLIDRKTRLMHDALLISIFAVTETNAIVLNWTGISLIEKGKIWLKSKVRQRAAASQGKRSVWACLAPRVAAKQPKQDN